MADRTTKASLFNPNYTATLRAGKYVAVSIILFFLYLTFSESRWVGNRSAHVLMETVSFLVAFLIGILALLRYYAKKSNTFLLLGAGFFGTAVLDVYHTFVTSPWFEFLAISPPISLVPWSWNASRYFWAALMLASFFAWRREKKFGPVQGAVSDKAVYYGVGAFTLSVFAFFAFFPLPRAYYPELAFGRPEELGTAFIILLAIIGYIKKGLWKVDHFEHWLIHSLVIAFWTQAIFVSNSYRLYDAMFSMGHVLKFASYSAVLIGLLIAMYELFQEVEEGRHTLAKRNKQLLEAKERAEMEQQRAEEKSQEAQRALIQAEETKKAIEQKSLETERLNKTMVGRELKMIELKEEIDTLRGQVTSSV